MEEIMLSRYADELFGGEDDLLREMREEAESEGLPQIQVPTELGRLLSILIAATRSTTVLEIGTLFGYSTIIMARRLSSDAELITLEVNPRHAAVAVRNIERAGLSDRVTVMVGPAVESLRLLSDRTFDLVFIDADKQSYPSYLEWALKLTHPGSIIAADNVWRAGAVLDPPDADDGTRGLARFNRALAAESRLTSTLIPTRDGGDALSLSLVVSPA